MATRKLLTNGNAFKRTDGRWGGTVWYMDESGERKRKSFSGTTKQEVNKKMTAYIENFNNEIETSIEANKTLKDSMTSWLQIFKFPSVERTTYDRYECTVENQIYPLIGNKIVDNITAADIKKVLNHWMTEGYAYTTVKKVHIILGDYFKYLMLSKFKIARKECVETESWLKLLFNTKVIDEETFKTHRNLCGRIQRMLTSSCITIEKKIENK